MDTHLTEVVTHLRAVDTHLAEVDTHRVAVDTHRTAMDTRLEAIDAHLAAVDTHIAEVDTRLTAIHTRLTAMYTTHRTAMDTQNTEMNTHLAEVDTQDTEMDTHLTAVATHDAHDIYYFGRELPFMVRRKDTSDSTILLVDLKMLNCDLHIYQFLSYYTGLRFLGPRSEKEITKLEVRWLPRRGDAYPDTLILDKTNAYTALKLILLRQGTDLIEVTVETDEEQKSRLSRSLRH